MTSPRPAQVTSLPDDSAAQLRRATHLRSHLVLVAAAFGAVLSLGLGVGFGILFDPSVRTPGLNAVSAPGIRNVAFLLIATAAGLLASVRSVRPVRPAGPTRRIPAREGVPSSRVRQLVRRVGSH
jgi:hypothetical protein